MDVHEKAVPRLYGWPLALIATAAFLVIVPFSWLGIPSGHDFEFHFNSWLEVLAHWKEGVPYPHWAALAHYDYGEARFIFYPPASWILGAMLGALLPWKFVSAAYVWTALTLCGSSMFLLARRYVPRADASFAAMVYVANPYHLMLVYWRSDMAELLASAYLPLLLLFTIRMKDDAWRSIAPLSVLLAAGWLTNVPTAIMMNYSFGFLVLWLAISKRQWKALACATIVVVLSAAMAAIYLVPVLHQQHWVNIGQVLSSGVRPVDNFLFTTIADRDHNQFNHLASTVAVWNMAVVVAIFVFSLKRRNETFWRFAAAWAVLCVVLMMSLTLPLWNHLPELRFVQFPWRWLICLNVAFAAGLALAFRRWWLRVAVCLLAIGSVAWVWQRVLPPWWDNSGDIEEMVDNQQDGIGNEGTDEYVPVGVDPYDIDQKAPQTLFVGAGTAQVTVEKWESEDRVVVADAASAGMLVLRLFNYPLWKVKVNGQPAQTETTSQTGQMIVPLPAGKNRVQIKFVEGWDRVLGGAISLLALMAVFTFDIKSAPPARMIADS